MTYILVTNDDGITAPGLLALVQALRPLGELSVSAPDINQSASGHKKTLYSNISLSRRTVDGDVPALAVGGSPADCIAVAALGLLKWPPRIVVSGINRGGNMGQDLTYSGTVTAALEATIHGVPSLAVSLANYNADDVADYQQAAAIARKIVTHVLKNGLPPFTILNLNIPAGPVRGLRLTRQGVRIYRDELTYDGDVVRIEGEPPTGVLDEAGTDIWAVHNGYASLTPIHLDMTAHRLLADLSAWDIDIEL